MSKLTLQSKLTLKRCINMEMKINSEIIIKQRKDKAWSQQHLAEVCDLSLRTIQRAENEGTASYETQKALCSAFGIDVKDIAFIEKTTGGRRFFRMKPLLLLSLVFSIFGSALVATVSVASTGITLHANSVSISKDQNTITFTGDVTILIPEEEPFEMSLLRSELGMAEPDEFNMIITNKDMRLLVVDPQIVKVDKKFQITTSRLQTTRL